MSWNVVSISMGANVSVSANGMTAFDRDEVDIVGAAEVHQGFSVIGFPSHTRWDGATWQCKAMPVPPIPSVTNTPGATVEDIDGPKPTDLWAVGAFSYWWPAGQMESHVMTWHWNGTTWSLVAGYNKTDEYSSLYGVCGQSDDAIWAVGMAYLHQMGTPLAEYWDGERWIGTPTPEITPASLRDVVAVSRSDVWAVGFERETSTYQPLAMHWDGADWRQSQMPGTAGDSTLEGTAVLATDDVWAVGAKTPSAHQALILHWDGTQWEEVPAPTYPAALLWDVAAKTPSDVVAVGGRWEGPTVHPLILHWDGTAWTEIPVATIPVPAGYPPVGNQYLRGVSAFAQGYWATGILVDPNLLEQVLSATSF